MADNANIHNDENWSAAGVVGMFDSALLSRTRRKHRWLAFYVCLFMSVALGIPLRLTWQKLEDSRRQTLIEEFSSRRAGLNDLANDKNPAVVAQLEKADQLRQQATTGSAGESVTVLREALKRLGDAAAIDQKIEQIRPLLNPLGETLSPTGTQEEGSPWLLSSAVIEQRLRELQKRHAQIVTYLDQAESARAERLLAELLRDVGQLQRDNVSAMHTETARRNWLRLQTKIPERLLTHAAWPAISRAGKDAEAGWDAGEWSNSKLLYLGAAEDLERFLNSESTPEEKAQLLQTDAEAIVRLETEKADLQQQIAALRQEKVKLGEQLSATNEQRLSAETEVAALTEERDSLREAEVVATAELEKLRRLEAELAQANTALHEAQDSVPQLTLAKTMAEESLQGTEAKLSAKASEINTHRKAASNEDENTALVQLSASLVAIDSKLAAAVSQKDDATAVKLAREQLADALSEYDAAMQLKQQAIAEKYLPTSSRVNAIDLTLAQAETTLRSGLKIVDERFAGQLEQLQVVINKAEIRYQTLLNEVAPDNEAATVLKQQMDGLRSQQSRLATAHDRHAGKSTPVAADLVTICRSEVQNLLAQQRTVEFERLKASGKVPVAAGIEVVPIAAGTFTMGEGTNAREATIDKPFYAGRYEVTVGQVLTWLNSSGVVFKNEWIDLSSSFCPVKKGGSKFELNKSSEFGNSLDQPMVEVTWSGAGAFCEWCSKQDPRFTYRLPTEIEWEYLARAGSTTAYPWGDSCNGIEANVDGTDPHGTTTEGPSLKKTTMAGSYSPNAWGIFDTVGNVWEWCENNDNTSRTSPLLRGGAWYFFPIDARSSNRLERPPDYTSHSIGFRVVAE
jgi:formylglycine-generating enzyme required for sulfatase activity